MKCRISKGGKKKEEDIMNSQRGKTDHLMRKCRQTECSETQPGGPTSGDDPAEAPWLSLPKAAPGVSPIPHACQRNVPLLLLPSRGRSVTSHTETGCAWLGFYDYLTNTGPRANVRQYDF